MSEKRKKVVVTVEQKLRAINRIDAGESAKKIALELGVGTWVFNKITEKTIQYKYLERLHEISAIADQ